MTASIDPHPPIVDATAVTGLATPPSRSATDAARSPEVSSADPVAPTARAARAARDADRAQTLRVIVKSETPILPRAAFTLITIASLGGAIFTGNNLGLSAFPLVFRWISLWAMGLAGGFLIWRTVYLRRAEQEVPRSIVDLLNQDLLERATLIGRITAGVVLVGAAAPYAAPYLAGRPGLRLVLLLAALMLVASLLAGIHRPAAAALALASTAVLIGGWALADVGFTWQGGIRALHLTAFSLWLGGALWNIFVQMPVGRKHPDVDAVVVGARQLDRFRWVVRFALPTIIVTGVVMAWAYGSFPIRWWTVFPGVLIPLKVLTIVALVVIFITCPLFRQCSPVQGVCNIDDLDQP